VSNSSNSVDLDFITTEISAFTYAGELHGCPFCMGRVIAHLQVGDKIVFLRGTDAGRVATVSGLPLDNARLFLVRYEDVAQNNEFFCSYEREEFLRSPWPVIPSWLPMLSIDDLCALENAIVATIARRTENPSEHWVNPIAKALASTAWHRRLPISGSSVFEILINHGFPEENRHFFVDKFNFAIEVLTSNLGRPSIKRKMVRAMSIGRYVPKVSRISWIEIFGRDPLASPFKDSGSTTKS